MRRLTFLLALLCVLVAAAPASANFGGLYTTYEDGGEASDVFVSNQNLWVYTLSDIAGGDVCVVEADLEDPGDGSLDCSSPAWGSKNHIGSVVGSHWTLIEVAYLKPGTYKLLGDGQSNTSVDVFSNEFTVYRCEPGNCDARIAQEVATRYKLAAANMALGMIGMQAVTALLTKIAPKEPFGEFKNWLNGIIDKAAEASAIWMRIVAREADKQLKPVTEAPDGPNAMALALLKQVVDGAFEMYMDIVNDPPDDYAEVAVPAFDLPELESGDADIDGMVLDIAQMTGYGTAGRIAYERYQLAATENSDAGVHRQAQAIAANNYALVEEMYATADNFEAFASRLAADPEWAGAKVVQEHVDTLKPIVERLKTSGFTAAENTELDALGFDAGGKAALRDELESVPLDSVPVDKPFETLLREVATTLRTEAPAFDEMARMADAVASSTNRAPVAGFTATPQSGPPPLEVTFTSTATDPDNKDKLTVTWDFGDGTATVTGTSVKHTYAVAGTYTVTQTVTDGHLTNTTSQEITAADVNQVPDAAFTATPESGLAPLEVSFDASASADPDGTIATYAWDFGDGQTGQGATPTHTFQTAGSFLVTLTVTDDDGGTDTATRTIVVSTPGNTPPSAQFTATPESGNAPLEVAFDASGSTDADGTIASYEWEFGDGGTTTGATPTHTFTTGGTYKVTLTVTDDKGARSTAQRTIVVNAAPTAAFTPSRTSGRAPMAVTFDASESKDSDGTIASYAWDFGDGETSTEAKPTHIFPAGTYEVKLTVTDDDGATHTTATVVMATEQAAPVAGFQVDRSNGPVGVEVTFTDNSYDPNGDPLTVSWDFDEDGTADATGTQVKHTFTETGNHTVTQTVSDGLDSTTSSKVIRVTAPPVAKFTLTPTTGVAPLKVAFDATASTDPDGFVANAQWSFGDGGAATGAKVEHTFTETGTYTVTLTVTDDLGETDSDTYELRVDGPPLLSGDTMNVRESDVLDVLANDEHPHDVAFTVIGTSTPEHGTVACKPLGGCLYTATPGYVGNDAFTYTVRDADGREATATVTVHVIEPQAVTPRFVLRDDDAVTPAGQAVVVNALANDEGPAPLTVDTTKTSVPVNGGTAQCTAAGSCTYTPKAGFSGYDAFTYTVKDGEDAVRKAAVRVTVAPATAAHSPLATGTPDAGEAVRQGQTASWAAAIGATPDGVDGGALKALAPPQLTVTLTGQHALEPGTLKTAPGWNAAGTGPVTVTAGAGALLGESVSTPLARPLPPISQGTGGDGHVPILVGSKVFAVFHHQSPSQITCADRLTGQLCPGYPKTINVGASDINGPAAVVGSKLYMHLFPATGTAQTAAVTLFCWDAATDRTCGLETLGRVKTSGMADASAPVLVDGKVYLAAFDDKLYCFDPATGAACAKPTVPLGMGILPVAGAYGFDILANGSRVYASQRQSGKVSCVDVSTGERCAGWTEARTFNGAWNLVRRHAADGAVNGMCVVRGDEARCWADATPDDVVELAGWPGTEGYYSVTQEAEAGTRTLLASHGMPGAACWDWATMARCTGGAYADGYIHTDIDGATLPSGYGIAWDGACAVGLGDPGLIYSVDPAGSAPCTSLGTGTEPLSVDLRDQRADGTVGAAVWKEVALLDTPATGTELTSFVVTLRDKLTGEQLLKKDLIEAGGTGKVDLSVIDPVAHPALTLEATSVSKAGDPAWTDGLPPRVRLLWQGDPQQVAFKTRAAVACANVAPIGISAVSAGVTGTVTKQLPTLRSLTCNDPPALELGADRTVDEQTPLDVTITSSDPQGKAPSLQLLEAPEGMTLADGHLLWTPTEAQGPGAHTVKVRATDDGAPALVADDTLTVTVGEVNRPPAIDSLGDVTVKVGEMLTANARASDPDLPANALSFSVVSPVGPTVDAATGAVSWKPAAPGSFPVTVRVTDSGSPPLSADAVLNATVQAAPAPPGPPAPVEELLLGCANRDLVLEDVLIRGSQVEFVGFADPRFTGQTVQIVYETSGKVVASPVVNADGSFTALAPLPPKKQRSRARYVARVGDERSLNLKLVRRMVVTGVQAGGGKVTFTGRVIPPLAQKKADRTIEIRRRVSCGKDEIIGKAKPSSSGAFRITLDAPAGVDAAVYRFKTKIRTTARSRRPTNTFTLPRVVLFSGS